MLDLTVSVPDHCLSFYFIHGFPRHQFFIEVLVVPMKKIDCCECLYLFPKYFIVLFFINLFIFFFSFISMAFGNKK